MNKKEIRKMNKKVKKMVNKVEKMNKKIEKMVKKYKKENLNLSESDKSLKEKYRIIKNRKKDMECKWLYIDMNKNVRDSIKYDMKCECERLEFRSGIYLGLIISILALILKLIN